MDVIEKFFFSKASRGEFMRSVQIPEMEQITSCIKCGACCRFSSPDLYFSDAHLVERGSIPLKYLFTMREGEPVKNPKTRKTGHLQSDIIKIKTMENLPTCIFLDDETLECGIYQSRPAICRAYKCWDKRQVEPVRSTSWLSRKDLLGETGLWDLIHEHQNRCDYRIMKELSDRIVSDNDEGSASKTVDMLAYDRSVRETAIEKGRMDPEIMDFLFGRPMSLSLEIFRLKVVSGDDGRQILTVL